MAMPKGFTEFYLHERAVLAILLDEDNIHLAAEKVEGTVLYTNGAPASLELGFNLEAELGEYIVKSEKDTLITDHETFDFFFNPID